MMKELIEKLQSAIKCLEYCSDKKIDDKHWNVDLTKEELNIILSILQSKGKTKEQVWEEVQSYHQIEGTIPEGSRVEAAVYDAMERFANQDGWVSVEERLPEPLERVLVYATDVALLCFGVAFYNGKYFQFDATMINRSTHFEKVSDKRILPTHWMPLPTPPQP